MRRSCLALALFAALAACNKSKPGLTVAGASHSVERGPRA
jgi:hypothetical protein